MRNINLKVAGTYFALVFGAGFALGCIRVPFLVPALGERGAELLEAPFMLAAIILAARWVVQKFPEAKSQAVPIGIIAVGLLLFAELMVGVLIAGKSPWEIFFNRDPISGSVYYALVGVFALMPALLVFVTRRKLYDN